MGFRCHNSDNPSCPPGLVCCLDGVCGNDLKDTDEGWCVPQPALADMTLTGTTYWPALKKTMYYAGDYMPDPLSGYDDQQQWRCTRDDTNPAPSDMVRHQGEPNDLPDQAIVLPNPLPVDLPVTVTGSAYQICPDHTAPDVPDIDVFKFKLLTPAKVIAEIKYSVQKGDLDLAVFRIDTDPDTGAQKPTLVSPTAKDVSTVDNGCVEIPSLAVGTYYVVVRGAPIDQMPGKYEMNNYNLRVFTVDQSGYSCTPKTDMH
jgi:hypothetical protein